MKRILSCFMLAMITLCASAVPAKRGLTKVITLTDGTTVTAQLVGDEHGHYWMAADGKAYLAADGSDVFQRVDAQQVMAHAKEKRMAANNRRTKRMAPRRVGEVGSYLGQKKGLIILVNFADKSFNSSNNNALYQRIANEENFSYGKFKGSMYDYFYAQSDGLFQLTFDVVGPVTVSKNASYYGKNDSSGNDQYPATMVIEAVQEADDEVNFADYDWDGDGEVDQVYVVYAGKGEADGGTSSTIWPHEWQLSQASLYGDGEGAVTLDGVVIDTYACGAELDGTTGTIAGIGTMCHEFSHCLGYPDFYDTDYSGGQGMGNWDLMDSGSYNGDGYQPAGYTSYERWVAGWKEPIVLTTSKTVTGMKSLQDGGESYIIYNGDNHNEYFLLENRQKRGWDASLPGAGLLILHVDYNAEVWAANEPNDQPSHQRMTWIPADNEYQYYTYMGTKYFTEEGMANDPYPYGSVNAFNKSTTPAAKFYNKNSEGSYYMDSSVENITQNNDSYKTVSFNFVGLSAVEKPVFSPEGGVYTETQQVTISCETEGASIYYTTDGTTPTAESTLYSEPITVETTTTIQAVAIVDADVSEVASARYVIRSGSQSEVTTFKKVASVDEMVSGKRYVVACGESKRAAGSIMSSSSSSYMGSVVVDLTDDVLTINDNVMVFTVEKNGDEWSFMNDDGQYLYATATKKVALGGQERSWTLSDGTSGVIMTFGNYGTMLYNVRSPRFTTYTSLPNISMIQANLYVEYVEEVEPETVEVTVGASGYATLYYGEKNLVVPAEVEARTYSVVDDNLTVGLTYTEGDVIPAATGVVLKAAADTYVFTVTEETGESDASNMLRGSDEDAMTTAGTAKTANEVYFYQLVAPEGKEVGFYWKEENGAPFESMAHKAYLVVPKTVARQVKVFLLEPKEETTDIQGVVAADGLTHAEVYDLQGRKMKGGHLPKGIYIVGGKKLIIK